MAVEWTSSSVYRTISTIGKGTFGKVNLVERDGQRYAVKKVNLTDIRNDYPAALAGKLIAMAEEEAHTLTHLEHKSIVQAFGFFKETLDGSEYYNLVLEYCDGGTLRSVIDKALKARKPFEERTIQSWTKQLANALNHIHQLGFVHRAVNPQSILLCHNERVLKLGDFGLAKDKEQVSQIKGSQTRVLNINGDSSFYESPEFRNGAFYTPKCDVWSLGVIAVELATLRAANAFAFKREMVAASYSDKLKDFISFLLNDNVTRRPTMAQVAGHAFLELPYVVLIGPVGSGKSTLGGKITMKQLVTSDFGMSQTRESTIYATPDFDLADTPGYQAREDKIDHAIHIAKALSFKPVSRILVLCKFENRVDTMLNNMECVVEPLSRDLYANMTIVVTHWDQAEKLKTSKEAVQKIIETKVREQFQITSILFVGESTTDVDLLLRDVVTSSTVVARQISIGVADLSRYFDLKRSETSLLRGSKNAIADYDEVIASVLKQADSIENAYDKQDFIFAMQTKLQDHIRDVRRGFISEFRLDENKPEDFFWLQHVIDTLVTALTKYTMHCQQYRMYLNGSLDKESPFRKCPHCGEIWTRVVGCDHDTTCGAVPSFVDADSDSIGHSGIWTWKKDVETGKISFQFNVTESVLHSKLAKRMEIWDSLIRKIKKEDFQIIFKRFVGSCPGIVDEERKRLVENVYNCFLEKREGFWARHYLDFHYSLALAVGLELDDRGNDFQLLQKCLCSLLRGELTAAQAVSKFPEKIRAVSTSSEQREIVLSSLSLEKKSSYYEACRAILRLQIKIPAEQAKGCGCGKPIRWSNMPTVGIPPVLCDSLINSFDKDNIVPNQAEIIRLVNQKLEETWRRTPVVLDKK